MREIQIVVTFAMLSRAKDEPKVIIMRFSEAFEGLAVFQTLRNIYAQKMAQGVAGTELLGFTKLVIDMTAITAINYQDTDKIGMLMAARNNVQVRKKLAVDFDLYGFLQQFQIWYLAPERQDCRTAHNDRINITVKNLGLDSAQVHRLVDVTLNEALLDAGLTAKNIDSLRWESLSA